MSLEFDIKIKENAHKYKTITKDTKLKDLLPSEKITELEALVMITEIMRRMKFHCKYHKDQILYSELNSTNIYISKYFDILLNFKNPVRDMNYYSPEYFNYFYFSEVENDYIQKNKIIVWSLGLVFNLILSGEEPWSRINGKNASILDLLCFSKAEIPYVKFSNFEISRKITNVDLKTMLKSCLEHNQLKRFSFEKMDDIINSYLTSLLVRDTNFDFFRYKSQKKDLLLLKKIYQFMINRVYDKNNKLKESNKKKLSELPQYELSKVISEDSKIQDFKLFQFDKRVTLIYFTKDYFKILRTTGETVLKYNNFIQDFGMCINSMSVIDGIYNMRPRIIIGFKNGELVKINSIYATRLDHFHLLKKKNISIDFFPEFNTEKIINQNDEYLIIWDINKNMILQSKETKESNNMLFLPSKDRNKNFKSLVFSKGGLIQSRDIHFGKNNWKITEGKKIKTIYDLKYDPIKDSVEITFMKKLDGYYSTHNDRIIIGFSNGYLALYQFFNSRCLFKAQAHRKKINDVIHLKEYDINYFASCSDSFTVKIWNFDTSELVSELKGHVKKITGLEYLKFINKQYIASFSNDGFVYIWDFITKEKIGSLRHKQNVQVKFKNYLNDFNPSSIITVTKDNLIYFWKKQKKAKIDTRKSFNECLFYGKINEDILRIKNIFFDKIDYTQTILDKKTKFDIFDEEIISVINKNKPASKEIDKRELSKLIKYYIGETAHKIELEMKYEDWKDNANQKNKEIFKQKVYINFVNRIMQLNNVLNSKDLLLDLIIEINENYKITSFYPENVSPRLSKSDDKDNDKNFFKNVFIMDNVKTAPFIYPEFPQHGKNNSFNHITNLKNFCLFFESNEVSTIERIHYFIEIITSLEKMFYTHQSFFRVKKDNIFIDKKTNRIKLITFYSHYNMHYDWRIYFRGIHDIKEKEEYLKTFFKFFKKYCLEDDILQVNMNEQGFTIDSLLEPSKLLWKNKHIFLFTLTKNYLKKYFDIQKLNVFKDKKLKNPKQLRIMNRVRDMMIYFYCKSFRYNSNESFLQRPVPQPVDLKVLKLQENRFDKVKCLVNLSNLNLIAIGGKKPFILFYDYFGVCKKIIDEANKNETIKCFLYLKEINYLCCGSNKGKIYIYELKGFKLNKILNGHGDNSVKSLCQLKGYDGRNDIFASCSKDKTIAIWDFQRGEKIRSLQDTSIIFKIYYSKTNNFIISTNKNRELSFWDIDSHQNLKPYTFHKLESVVSVLEYFKNCCEEETICIGSLVKMNNIKSDEDIDHMNTNIKLFLVRKCLMSQKPAFEFTVVGNCVKVANIFDFGKDIIVTAEKISGKFLFWNIKRDKENFKELLLCYVYKCNFLYFEKKIVTFIYLKNLDKLTFCVASQYTIKDNNTVLFELNANEI